MVAAGQEVTCSSEDDVTDNNEREESLIDLAVMVVGGGLSKLAH